MIRNKKALIKSIFKIGEDRIKQGILFKELAFSIEQRQKDKTLKEWLEFVNSQKIIREVEE